MKAVGIPIVPASLDASGGLLPGVLVPGRLYMVNVLQRDGDRALVAINGRRVAAEVIGSLPDQGRVPVLVREVSAERVVLQRAPETATPVAPAPLTSADLSTILSRIGLPVRQEYITCLAELVHSGQPVVPDAVLELAGAWSALADSSPESLPVLARLQSQGLPLLDETFAAALRWEASEPLVTADNILRLTQAMAGLAQRIEADSLRRQLEPLPLALRTMARALAALPLVRGADLTLPGQISNAVQTLSTPLEAMLARLPSLGLLHAPTNDTGDAAADAARGLVGSAALAAGTATGTEGSAMAAYDGGELILRNPGSVKDGVPALERNTSIQLRRLSNALDHVAERAEKLLPETREALEQTRTALHELLARSDAQQLANLRAPADSTVPHYYAFSLPIAWSGTRDEAALRVYYRPGRSRRVDPANTHLAFRLSVAPLGTVEIDLRVFRRIVACDVRTESQAINSLAVAESPGLHCGLQKLGYQVQAIRCSVQESPAPASGWAPQVSLTESLAEVDMVV